MREHLLSLNNFNNFYTNNFNNVGNFNSLNNVIANYHNQSHLTAILKLVLTNPVLSQEIVQLGDPDCPSNRSRPERDHHQAQTLPEMYHGEVALKNIWGFKQF